jgi:hypothetical protein
LTAMMERLNAKKEAKSKLLLSGSKEETKK